MKLQNETVIHGKWYGDACGAAFAMELIGERWTLLIVRELMIGGRRFSDIRASLPGMSAKVLAERLERLAALGVLTKRKLPAPASSAIYELTPWGHALEPVMQELGRWAVQSPLHDTTLPLSPVSFMLSLRTMIDHERARGMEASVLFEIGSERFLAILAGGDLAVERADGPVASADLAFRAGAATQLAQVFYGKAPLAGTAVDLSGNRDRALRFIDLFHLPEKCGGLATAP